MAKNGLTWKAAILIVTVGGMVIAACYGLAVANTIRQGQISARVTGCEVRDEGLKETMRDIKREQIRQSAKLDKILERLP